MAALQRLFGSRPARPLPSQVESDEIYPVHMLDDTTTLRSIIVTWTLRFNDVLDPEKLHTSMWNLLEIGDWRKLGGRLRLKKNGGLEIHVPRAFTKDRPPVYYTSQSLPMNIEDHPLASTLPKSTDAPSIQAGPEAFRIFAAPADAPEVIEEYLNADAPQLSLHITSFNNATLVGLSWPHTLMDVMGQQALLRSWSLVLAGLEADLPPVLGAREDAIRAAVDAPAEKAEEYTLAHMRLRGWAMVKFGLRFASDLLWNRVVETRSIFLPKRAMAYLRDQAQADIAVQDVDAEKSIGKQPFISEGDVLTAWTVRAVASSLSQERPIVALHALNARFRLSSLAHAYGIYAQNMAVAAFASISAKIATGSLGAIALENRRHLMEQSTEPQVLAYLRELQSDGESISDPATMLFCTPDTVLMPFTNWTRAEFFKVADFSPAVVRAGETGVSRSNPPGTMVYHHANSMRQKPTARHVVVVLGKDHEDNYWLTGTLLPATWARIEEELEEMRKNL